MAARQELSAQEVFVDATGAVSGASALNVSAPILSNLMRLCRFSIK